MLKRVILSFALLSSIVNANKLNTKPAKKAAISSAWVNQNAEKKIVAGKGAAAAKGSGVVEASSGWSGSSSRAEGSEGSITNSDFKANQDAWGKSWATQKNGKAKEAWKNDFGLKQNVAAASKSAHQGTGGSSTSSGMKGASGTAQGSQGSAVDNSFKKNYDAWGDSWGSKSAGKKSLSFKQTFADKQQGASTARAIGYGASTASGKAAINKSMIEAEGQAGAQGSTASKFAGDSWNNSWGQEKNGKKNSAFQNNFANKVTTKGSTSTFGVGDAAVKGLTSATSGSKAVAKGLSGSGSNSDFKGNKDGWTDSWAKSSGKMLTIIGGPALPAPPKMGDGPAPAPVAAPVNLGTAAPATPEQPAPAEGAPAEGAPAEGAPAEGAPAEGAPAEGAPAEGAPAEGAPAEGAPAEGAPAEGAAAEGEPAEGAAAEGAAAENGHADAAGEGPVTEPPVPANDQVGSTKTG